MNLDDMRKAGDVIEALLRSMFAEEEARIEAALRARAAH